MKMKISALAAALSLFLTPGLFAISYVVPSDEAMVGRADVIVVARAIASYAEENEHGIATFTRLSIEDVLKGDRSLLRGLTVREPGGVIESAGGKRIRLFPGAPRFTDGERVLLHLLDVGDGLYAVLDLELGFMKLADDDLGHHVAFRAATDGLAWDIDGKVHKEPRRDADKYIEFLREVAQGRPANPDYAIEPRPMIHDLLRAGSNSLHAAPLAVYTITQYTIATTNEASSGSRWPNFPSVVNWNRGNSMAHLTNGGSDAINLAFTNWAVGTSVNLALASTTANTNGICGVCGDTADGINNIVFERNLTADGAPAFSCASGGIFGEGSPHTYSVTNNTLGGETFLSITESDVSFNQGVDACIGPSWPAERIGSALMHEIGHGLGLRHSDSSRDLTQPCTSMGASYDCGTTAIMQATVAAGLNSTQQAWDTRAITALYPPSVAPGAPTGVVASTTSATQILVSWTAPAGGATKYHVYRCNAACANPANYGQINGETTTTTSYTDTVGTKIEYIYKIRAVNASNVESADSNKDIGLGVAYTDPVLATGSAGTKVKAAHITELRTIVNSLCTVAGTPSPCATPFTDPTITAGASGTKVKAVHITEMRAKIAACRTAMGLSAASFTDPTLNTGSAGTFIKKVHIDDLRDAVK
jgi:hypothetical protein